MDAAAEAELGVRDESAKEYIAMGKAVNNLRGRSGKLRALAMLFYGFDTKADQDYRSKDSRFKYMYNILQALVVSSTGCDSHYGEARTVLGVQLYPDGNRSSSKSHKSQSVTRLKVRAALALARVLLIVTYRSCSTRAHS